MMAELVRPVEGWRETVYDERHWQPPRDRMYHEATEDLLDVMTEGPPMWCDLTIGRSRYADPARRSPSLAEQPLVEEKS